ncbi:MAG TPA: saccharopine dehydrogenase NADP-binding domain-containing protein [Limnochordales bacterium]
MRFVVFGGSGDMGRRACLELARTPGVQHVTIVGRSLESARRAQLRIVEALATADQRKGEGRRTACEVTTAAVDAADQEAVAALMREHDVAVGALGPFYLYEESLVRAAIAARKPYVSICDDADATAAALALDEAARAAGVSVLTGMGWTPGLSNILARRAAAQLDEAKAVRIAWAGSAGEAPGPAVVLHTMHIFSGRVITFAGGRHQRVKAGSEPEQVRFPAPLGPVTVCHVGHPEPLTLPQHLPGVELVTLKGGVVEPLLQKLAVWTGRLGLTATHGRRRFLAGLLRPLIPPLSRVGAKQNLSGLVVRVEGRKEGRPRTIESAAVASIDALTSVPLALGALWLARNPDRPTGVFPPEAAGGPDPEEFLAQLQERGVSVVHSVET